VHHKKSICEKPEIIEYLLQFDKEWSWLIGCAGWTRWPMAIFYRILNVSGVIFFNSGLNILYHDTDFLILAKYYWIT
jgi:hypothetical protein